MRSALVAMDVSIIVGAEEVILEGVIGFGGGLVLSEQPRTFEIEADTASQEWLVNQETAHRSPDRLRHDHHG